jgi:hypothetical protein
MGIDSHKSASRINAAWAEHKAQLSMSGVKVATTALEQYNIDNPDSAIKFRTPQQTSTAALSAPLYQRLLTREQQAD